MYPHYIIDGYNLIYHIQKFREALDHSLEQARDHLISFLRSYRSTKRVKFTVVFDGAEVGFINGSHQSSPWLRIIYSKPPEKADPVIKRLIRKAKNQKATILVSADSELIQFSRQMGAQVLSPEDFYQRASKHPHHEQIDQKYNSHITKAEIDEWLKLFEGKPE